LLATYKALAFACNDIKILAKDAGIKLSKVERNGAFKAMKIYTFVAEV